MVSESEWAASGDNCPIHGDVQIQVGGFYTGKATKKKTDTKFPLAQRLL